VHASQIDVFVSTQEPSRVMQKNSSSPLPSASARHAFFRPTALLACFFLSACLPSFSSKPSPAPQTESKPAAQAQKPPTTPVPPGASLCLSLALPLQGQAKSNAEKIAQGASVAKRELEVQGTVINVRVLDADQPDWLNQLAALPPECALVGGPTHAAAYSAAKKSPAAAGRAFFTFLPQLEPGDEGLNAWRFFPSPQDQADALQSFLQIEMGFTSYGVLYPDEAYGRRMAEIFRQRAALRGATAQTASYTPGAAATWPAAVAQLVGRREINKTPFPTANLQAVFLPNSWSSADQLITSLHYNGEDRLVLLGDSLWGEGIQIRPPAIPRHYQLAVFPAAWNPGLASPGAQALLAGMQGAVPDFWIGLGYDFLHFAVQMKLTAGWTPQLVAQRAAEAQRNMAWSMAPLTWDAQGKAAQALFLFSPVAGGFAPVQPEQLKASWLEAQARFAERTRIAQGESPVPALLAPAPGAGSPWRLPSAVPPPAPGTNAPAP
jgi:ABC-type branched-subunit amino acid transport system substrate-binding protein